MCPGHHAGVLLSLALAGLAGAACAPGTRCDADGQCPPLMHCRLSGLGEGGTCAQECVTSVTCGAGRSCSPRGRCAALDKIMDVTVESPAPGALLTAGQQVEVRGQVTLGSEPVVLTLSGADAIACTPAPPLRLEFPATFSALRVPYSFPGVPVGEGGGGLTVTASSAGLQEAASVSYESALVCADCPSVTLEEPGLTQALPELAFGMILSGRVEGARHTPLLFSLGPRGEELVVPLTLSGSEFRKRVMPVPLGNSQVGVEVRGDSGATRRCFRHARSQPTSVPLSAHLSWEGQTADLDLSVVPPAARLSGATCRHGVRLDGCSVPGGDRRAPGPEAALISNLVDGAWGVAVLAVPGVEGPVRATVTILSDGAVLWQTPPRLMDPRRPDLWLVARVTVTGTTRVLEPLDRVVVDVPAEAPAGW